MRLTCHLGLVCPEGAKVRVGPTWGTWQEPTFFFLNTAEAIDLEVVHVFEWHEEKLQTELLLTGRQMYFLR